MPRLPETAYRISGRRGTGLAARKLLRPRPRRHTLIGHRLRRFALTRGREQRLLWIFPTSQERPHLSVTCFNRTVSTPETQQDNELYQRLRSLPDLKRWQRLTPGRSSDHRQGRPAGKARNSRTVLPWKAEPVEIDQRSHAIESTRLRFRGRFRLP